MGNPGLQGLFMTKTISLPLSQPDIRVDSVDIMRGLIILVMAFVNDIADFAKVKGIP